MVKLEQAEKLNDNERLNLSRECINMTNLLGLWFGSLNCVI